jgi:hypothetical protein
MRSRIVVAVLALLAGAAWPAVAGAAPVDDVAAALRSDPLYVDVAAERALSESEAGEVRDAIRRAGTPIYVAVLPASAVDAAGGDAGELAGQLAAALQRDGTVAVLAGDSLRAGSSELPSGRAGELVIEALDAGGGDTSAVLVDFVELVGDEVASGSGEGGAGGESAGDDGGGNAWVLPAVLVGGAGNGGAQLLRSSRRRRAERERAEAADRELLRAELSVLADDVVRLEPVVQLHPDAQSDFDAAVNRYRAAQAAIDHADEPIDLVRVRRVVDEARYSMDRARAVVDGREPPPPPAHLRRMGDHGEPAVTIDDDRQPAYVGYPGGYGAGWYGGMGGGGLFSGLLLGSLLAGGFGGWGHGHTTIINEGDGGDAGGWDGGDFGGGDFGGGDFGGGDFGG